jgi:hypothetical protein
MVWNLPPDGSRTETEFHRDNVECQMTARSVVGDQFAMGTPLFIAMAAAGHNQAMREADKECLLGKGYVLADPGR